MPARSMKQQMAAGAALAAKRGERSKASLRHAPPAFSQHAAEILGEAGLKKNEIDDLLAERVVSPAKPG